MDPYGRPTGDRNPRGAARREAGWDDPTPAGPVPRAGSGRAGRGLAGSRWAGDLDEDGRSFAADGSGERDIDDFAPARGPAPRAGSARTRPDRRARGEERRGSGGSRVTAVVLLVALAGSTLFILYGIFARDATQVPILCAGFAVFGIVFAALALAGAVTTFREARVGQAGRSFAFALGGGVAALIAAASFATAVVLALVWGSGG